MSRKYIAVLVIVSLLSLNTLTPAQAFWPFGSSEPTGKDLRFNTVYPVSFWKSTTGKIVVYVGLPVAVAVITYFTAGAGGVVAGQVAQYIECLTCREG